MNYKIFKSINRLSGHYSPIDLLMIFISNKLRYVFLFVLIFMWFRNDFSKRISFLAVISAGVALFLNTLIKLFYFTPRPFVKRRVGILIPSKTDSSFPSKHTILAFAVSTSILLYKRTLGLIMWTLSMLTGFSRIWIGHHYPFDILGSAFIGTMTSILVNKIFRRVI
ncbi:undecaprenyl-diphosphatase [Ectobacillus sp. sgz5001026]|uniref:undecaprenyl-diphosphatase n=1 Tax=Ectobacillus sp. sgz5001026 TaxID=3242473 RepID=UPI0036D2ADC4